IGLTRDLPETLLEVVEVRSRRYHAQFFRTQEGRIPHDSVEAGVLSFEHFWELDLPVERDERRFGGPPFFGPPPPALPPARDHGLRKPASLPSPLRRLGAHEDRRHREIAEEPHLTQLELCLAPEIAKLPVGDGLVRLADTPA